ncbi:MAG: hypothetical protein ACXW5U_03925 [Thermoanaerobaculia bacterium]
MPLLPIFAFYIVTYTIYQGNIFVLYPPRNDLLLSFYLAGCMAAILFGYFLGTLGPRWNGIYLRMRPVANIGLLAVIVLFIPAVKAYTGQGLQDISRLFLDPAAAHSQMVEVVAGSRDERLWLLLVKSLASPFTVVVVPFFAYRCFHLGKDRWRFITALLLMVLFSVFRGTDKELFDAFILSAGAYTVAVARDQKRLLSPRVLKWAAASAVLLVLLIALFGFRKVDRIGPAAYRCLADTDVCHPLAFGGEITNTSVTVVMLANYLTQGYHGLASALDGEFHTGWGVGHSRPLRYLAGRLGLWTDGMLTDQLDRLGWATKALWSSGLTWIANDVGFFGVPLILAMMAMALPVAWKQAIIGWLGAGRGHFRLFVLFIQLSAGQPATGSVGRQLHRFSDLVRSVCCRYAGLVDGPKPNGARVSLN